MTMAEAASGGSDDCARGQGRLGKDEEQECVVQGSSRCPGRGQMKRDISAVNHGELNRLLAPDFCYALQLWDGPFPRKLRVRSFGRQDW